MRSSLLALVASLAFASIAQAYEDIDLPRADGAQTPVRLYGNWSRCTPTIILSHGLGGNREGLAYIGESLAPLGYRVAVMSHAESGRRELLRTVTSRDKSSIITDPAKYAARFMDIDTTLSFATRGCRPALLALGGHSMGAATTMLEAGARGKVRYGGADRFDAYIALSPQGVGWMFDHGAWQSVRKPVLMITGTEDNGYDGDYTTRLVAFHELPPGKKRLAIIDGANHLNLGGRRNEQAQRAAVVIIRDFIERYDTIPTVTEGVAITDK